MSGRDREEQEETNDEACGTDDQEGPSRDASIEAEERLPISCFVCKASVATYGPLGCQHRTLCKRCAMKQATGGKCKVRQPLKKCACVTPRWVFRFIQLIESCICLSFNIVSSISPVKKKHVKTSNHIILTTPQSKTRNAVNSSSN
jgi:hypothetical protein